MLDAVLDTLYLIPFLYVTYLFMEWLNLKTEDVAQDKIRNVRKAGPAIGALLGLLPQCGFSAATAALYAARIVTRGTLIAVFLTTSDEMLPIFIAKQVPIEQILAVLGGKLVVGIVAGFAFDIVLNFYHKASTHFRLKEVLEDDSDEYDELADFYVPDDYSQFEDAPVQKHHYGDPGFVGGPDMYDDSYGADMFPSASDEEWDQYECQCAACVGGINLTPRAAIFVLALMHTVQVTLFIFAVTLGLDILIELVGEDALGAFLAQNEIFAIFASAIVGLIPNCAASVVIADLWVDGVLQTGAMFSGLLVSCGIGYLVLFRTNNDIKRNLSIVATMLFIGVICGLLVSFFL